MWILFSIAVPSNFYSVINLYCRAFMIDLFLLFYTKARMWYSLPTHMCSWGVFKKFCKFCKLKAGHWPKFYFDSHHLCQHTLGPWAFIYRLNMMFLTAPTTTVLLHTSVYQTRTFRFNAHFFHVNLGLAGCPLILLSTFTPKLHKLSMSFLCV